MVCAPESKDPDRRRKRLVGLARRAIDAPDERVLQVMDGFKVTRVVVSSQGQRDQSMLRLDERVDARGRTYFWVGFKRIFTDPERGTDLHAIAEGCISVTPLHMDLTEHRERQRLSEHLEGSLVALARGLRKQRSPRAKPLRKSSGRVRRAAKG